MKFRNRVKFLETVNTWVRDGSNITEFWSNVESDVVILRGPDGAREELWLFNDEADYAASDHTSGAN